MSDPATSAIAELRRLVKMHGDGPVAGGDWAAMLAGAWPALAGSEETSMRQHKLIRSENLRIEDGRLLFEIERHGATVHGSTRAELQTWCVDLESRTAWVAKVGRRQLYPTAARWTTAQADEVARQLLETVESGESHPGLTPKPGGLVVIDMTKWIPLSGYEQTDAGRRRRFRDALAAVLMTSAWTLTRHGSRLALRPRNEG